MSIFAYVGLPGAGKSYSVVVNQILPALRRGRTVVTNVPLNRDEVRRIVRTGEIIEFPIEEVLEFPERVDDYALPGCVLVLDEIWRLWPAGQKVDRVPEPFKSLLAEHRHRVDRKGNSMQVVLVTQDLSQCGAFARQLVEQTIYHTKLTTVGMSGKFRADIYQGPVSGATPPAGKRVREVFGRYRKEVFAMYKSHTMASEDAQLEAVNEKGIDTRGNYFKRPMIVVGAVFVVSVCLLAFPYLSAIASGDRSLSGGAALSVDRPDDRGSVVAQAVVKAPPTTPRVAVGRRILERAPEYIVNGYLFGPEGSTAFIVDNGHVVRVNFMRNCEFIYREEFECSYRGWRVGAAGAIRKLAVLPGT